MPPFEDQKEPYEGQNKFQTLVQQLSKVLEPSSGLSFYDVDPNVIINAMEDYHSNPDEWRKYALADPSRAYTRNLVHRGNGKSNLLVLVWTPGRKSPIHDHAGSHCVMKVLQGELTETRYHHSNLSNTSKGSDDPRLTSTQLARPLKVTQSTTFQENAVTYMSDDLGLHSITNSGDNFAVSLHLYTPPNAEKFGCRVFDENTGKGSRTGGCTFFSVGGAKI